MDVIFVNDFCFYLNIMLYCKIWWPLDKVYTIHKVGKSPKVNKYVFRAMDHKTSPSILYTL